MAPGRPGRPRKYANPSQANAARRARRQAQAPQTEHQGAQPWTTFEFPGQMVWDATTGSLDPPSLSNDGPLFLENILPSTEVDPTLHRTEDSDNDDDDEAQPSSSQGRVNECRQRDTRVWSLSPPPPPMRSSRSGSTTRPLVPPQPSPARPLSAARSRARDSTNTVSRPGSVIPGDRFRNSTTSVVGEPCLPATLLAHFLTTQLLSPDPAQTLLALAQDAPGAQPPLLRGLEEHHHDNNHPSPNSLSLVDGLEHIQSQYGVPLPDIISEPFIQRPSVEYTAEEMQYLFTGYTCDDDRPLRPAIDPLVGGQDDYDITTEFDIDSLIIFSSHLGVFRRGILWYPTQMPMGAVTTGMHMTSTPVQFTDSHGHLHQQHVPLHHVPNYCFARLPGADGFTVHWFFPKLYTPSDVSVAEKEGQRLTDFHFARWTDQVLIPSLAECLPPGRVQHLPSSFKHAQANTRAFFRETRITDVNTGAHHQNLQYEIPAQYLPAVQDAITRRLAQPGNRIFQDAFLVVVGKGLKLQPWKTPSLVDTVDYFLSWLDRSFDPQYLSEDAVYVDVGKETLSTSAASMLWREDFLRLFAATLQACVDEHSTLKPTLYPWGFVRGVGSATLEIPLQSPLRAQGVAYIQHYPSFKNIFAAGNTYTFSNQHVSNLTLNPDVLSTFQQIGGAISVRPHVLARAYIHSKLRSHYGLASSSDKSYSARWESRVTLRLLRQIHQCARHASPPEPFRVRPSCAWVAHPTEVLTDWHRFHLNKFCFAFESAYGRCQEKPYIAWEHTQFMILMLKCISCFAGVLIPGTYPQLWRDYYQPARPHGRGATAVVSTEHRHGLAIGVNMLECGYGWLADKIDWEQLVLRPEVSGQFQVQQVGILAAFRANYQRLRNHMDDYVLVASSASLISKWKSSPVHLAYLLRLLRAICLRALLRDVFQVLRPSIRPDRWTKVETGHIGLSHDALDYVLDNRRASIQIINSPYQKIRNFHSLFQFLWGEDEVYNRGPWQRLPYRMLYTLCRQIITDILGKEHFQGWRRLFSKCIRTNCWLLPYPDSRILIYHERDRQGRDRFRWWSNYNHKLAQYLGEDPDQVVRCRLWYQWPKGCWSVTPESGFMRGRPRPDIRLAFLRPDQVVEQLQSLDPDSLQHPHGIDGDDEDGLEFEDVRDTLGERQLDGHPSGGELSSTDADESDSSTLSEYQDRRRLRQNEKEHWRQGRRWGGLRRSLRLEKQAYERSLPRPPCGAQGAEFEAPLDEDIVDMMDRYDIRLAHVSEQEAQHLRMAATLARQRSSSFRHARQRQNERATAEYYARLDRIQRERQVERARRQREEEEAQARAAAEEERWQRQEQNWLELIRERSRKRPRQVLGELSTREYPREGRRDV